MSTAGTTRSTSPLDGDRRRGDRRRGERDRGRAGAGSLALALAVIGLIGAIACAALCGLLIGPLEAAHGRHLGDIPDPQRSLLWGLFASQAMWAGIGLAGGVTAVLALRRRAPWSAGAARRAPGRARAITALVIVALAPGVVVACGVGGLLIGALAVAP